MPWRVFPHPHPHPHPRPLPLPSPLTPLPQGEGNQSGNFGEGCMVRCVCGALCAPHTHRRVQSPLPWGRGDAGGMGLQNATLVGKQQSFYNICSHPGVGGAGKCVAIPMCFPRPAHKTGSPARTASLHLANRTGTEHPAPPGEGQRHAVARFLQHLPAPIKDALLFVVNLTWC